MTAVPVTEPVKAREMTEARMGPTQGVQIKPKLIPTTTPPKKPDLLAVLGTREDSRANNFSVSLWADGKSKVRPKTAIITTDSVRKESAGIPTALTRVVKKRVKKVKLITKPATTPKARDRPPPRELVRTIGNTGRMQGERMVTTPAKKAKAVSNSTSFNIPNQYDIEYEPWLENFWLIVGLLTVCFCPEFYPEMSKAGFHKEKPRRRIGEKES